jgi:putative transposase
VWQPPPSTRCWGWSTRPSPRGSPPRLPAGCCRSASGGSIVGRPGGGAVHGLLDEEVEAILKLAEQWGEIDRSHRKLAHRGSYLHRVWVSPASVFGVLAAHDLVLPKPPGRAPVQRTPWPDWITYRPNQVWGWDVTHFGRCRAARCGFAIIDLAGPQVAGHPG